MRNTPKLSATDNRKYIRMLSTTSDDAVIRSCLNKLSDQVGFSFEVKSIPAGLNLWRVVDLPQRGSIASDFSYPPNPEYCKLGRCSMEGQQVFYAGNNLGACIMEMKELHVGKQFRAGYWEVTREMKYLNFSTQGDLNKKSKKIHTAIADLLKHKGDLHYPRTSVIVDWVFKELNKQITFPDFPFQIDAISYPSTLAKSINEYELKNYVFPREFVVNAGLRLVEWHHMEVVQDDNGVPMVCTTAKGSINKAIDSQSSKLSWIDIARDRWVSQPREERATIKWNGNMWEVDWPL